MSELFFQDCGTTDLSKTITSSQSSAEATIEDIRQGKQLAAMKLSLDELRVQMFRVVSAMTECHAQQTIHRKVKPGKFLVDADGRSFLSSFRIAIVDGGSCDERKYMSRVGSLAYLAPEALLGSTTPSRSTIHYTDKLDVWATGLLMAELAAGCCLFGKFPPLHQLDNRHAPRLARHRCCCSVHYLCSPTRHICGYQ